MLVTPHCPGCGRCTPLCPQGAIRLETEGGRRRAVIDDETCLECGVCLDSGICAAGALREGTRPRDEIRRLFGRMTPRTPGRKKSGRTGAWDVKTCDAGLPLPLEAVIARVELGRPHGGVTLAQAEELRRVLLQQGYQPEEQKAYRKMLELIGPDGFATGAGAIRVLSVCLEYRCEPDRLSDLLTLAAEWARQRDVRYRVNALFAPALLPALRRFLGKNGRAFRPRCKWNLGLAHREDTAL